MIFTSKMKNLAVFALPQVFFRRDTGLMFMPATRRNGFRPLIPDHARVFPGNYAHISQNGTHRWWPWGSWSCRCWNTPWQRQWRTLSPGPSASSSPAWKKAQEMIFFQHHKKLCQGLSLYISAPCKRACSNIKTTVGGSNTLQKVNSFPIFVLRIEYD